jgi:hypothetical protein
MLTTDMRVRMVRFLSLLVASQPAEILPKTNQKCNWFANRHAYRAHLDTTTPTCLGARGLGICGVGAFFDGEVDELLRLQDTPHRSLYLMGVGARS